MAFLNNSGDIILDAVLTDLGRQRLSKGDGSFKIAKFALGDDEIDYTQYVSATGTAYQDLDILQTPVLEAITDNISSMKSQLVTYSRTDLLYLPSTALNVDNSTGFNTSSIGTFVALVNPEQDFKSGQKDGTVYGFTNGSTSANNLNNGNFFARTAGARDRLITINQGLDTTQVSFTEDLPVEMTETDYFIYLDNRLGTVVNADGTELDPVFIDDDNIATYLISTSNGDNATNFQAIRAPNASDTSSPSPAIEGPYNRQALRFSVRASDNLAYSDFLFEKFGNTSDSVELASVYNTVYNIDTDIRVSGVKTGYNLNVPLRFVKVKTF